MKMKMLSKCITLVSILALAVVAGVPVAFAEPSSGLANVGKPYAVEVNEPVALGSPRGESDSGWKPDAAVASGPDDEVDPSIGSYVDPETDDVTLYVAYAVYHNGTDKYDGRVARSFDQGATWWGWWSFWWVGAWSVRLPSLVVNAYNNTVFVATESFPIEGGNHRVDVWRFTPGHWEVHLVDSEDARRPSLTVEYSFMTNWLFVSYERYTTMDDRDLYVARSTDWGKTWGITLLRGGPVDTTVYTESDITYAQGNVYIAFRHSTDWFTEGHIDVCYSTDYGGTWNHAYDVSGVPNGTMTPSIAGSRFGPWHQPAVVIIAYDYAGESYDILYTWSDDYGASWDGGDDSYHRIAASAESERFPQLSVDGMGTESRSVGGNFHLVYWKSWDLYYTQLPYWDIPNYYGGPYAYWGYYLGWSSPHGLISDDAAYVGLFAHAAKTITTYTRTVGEDTLWEPAVAWLDGRNPSWDIYYSTPGTDFSITFFPSSQTVVAGKSASYYVTVNRLSGPAAPAYLGGTVHYPVYQSVYARMSYSVSPITPTATSTLTVSTSNLMPPGAKQLTAAATIGGYRRWVLIPYTVTAPPTLTLDLDPTTVSRGAGLTVSGQLSPGTGAAETIYLYYRFPHEVGSWKKAAVLTTNAAGAYSRTVTVPMGVGLGDYDLVTFWVDLDDGSYATSSIKVLTIIP